MALKYRGPLFGQIGRRHIPLEMHSDDVDAMERELYSLRSALAEKTAQVEAHKYALGQVTIQRDEAREQVERLREAIAKASSSMKEFSRGWRDDSVAAQWSISVAKDLDEALAATAPDVKK